MTIKMKAGELVLALEVLQKIVSEGRAMSVKGRYRVARMALLLGPQAKVITSQRDELIKKHGVELFEKEIDGKKVEKVRQGDEDLVADGWQPAGWKVLAAQMPAFVKEWTEVCEDTIDDITCQPIPLSSLETPAALGAQEKQLPGLSEKEFALLGPLVVDDEVVGA